MYIARVASLLSLAELEPQLKTCSVLALNPKKISSQEELHLAYKLAQRSFKEKKNIAKQLPFEVLLWLGGRRDIARALQEYGAKSPSSIILLIFNNKEKTLKNLKAKVLPLKLKEKADWQVLERISLSRI